MLEAKYEAKPVFPRGGGCKTKYLPWGEYEYFLELHIAGSCDKHSAYLSHDSHFVYLKCLRLLTLLTYF